MNFQKTPRIKVFYFIFCTLALSNTLFIQSSDKDYGFVFNWNTFTPSFFYNLIKKTPLSEEINFSTQVVINVSLNDIIESVNGSHISIEPTISHDINNFVKAEIKTPFKLFYKKYYGEYNHQSNMYQICLQMKLMILILNLEK